ncbi:MAG: hypothetical protein AB7P40_00265 [Chloroflexota bacterium]
MRLTLARFEPDAGPRPPGEGPPNITHEPAFWDVAFDVVLSDGSVRYCPTTVHRSRLADTRRSTIIYAADQAIRPGLVAEEARINAPAPPPAPDWFDSIAGPTEDA